MENRKIGKFINISWPYFWLSSKKNPQEKKWVIFLGNDFFNTTKINFADFIEKNNQCINYIKKNCQGCDLFYRPHPEERNETKQLNLDSFIIQNDGLTAEEFIYNNREKIKHTFSFCSTSSIAAYNMGVNSHVFYRCFSDIFTGVNKIFTDNYLKKMPENFFINNFEESLNDNKILIKEDVYLTDNFKKILSNNSGPVWFFVVENRYLLAILSLSRMIKTIHPDRKINLVISRHHRWLNYDSNEFKKNFNRVIILPRVFYSLRPERIIKALLTAQKIEKIKIESGSIFVGFAHHDFVENCFMSYNTNIFKIAILPESVWKLNFKTEELGFDVNKFKFNKAGYFFNRFFEPLLGLNRTKFIHHEKDSNVYFIRLEESIESIYDLILLINNVPVSN